jgi:hypothetical protein
MRWPESLDFKLEQHTRESRKKIFKKTNKKKKKKRKERKHRNDVLS